MPRVTMTHRAAVPDLDQRGEYHPQTLMRLGQEAVEGVQRDAGILLEISESSRVSELRLLCHSTAGRDDELEITAELSDVTKTSVAFAFGISTGGRQVAEGLCRRVFDNGVDAGLIGRIDTALRRDGS